MSELTFLPAVGNGPADSREENLSCRTGRCPPPKDRKTKSQTKCIRPGRCGAGTKVGTRSRARCDKRKDTRFAAWRPCQHQELIGSCRPALRGRDPTAGRVRRRAGCAAGRTFAERGSDCAGRNNTPQLLVAWETDNLLYGRTNNPWDIECTPGGSSGGEAAAIAAGRSAGGVGSDRGGSIRVPAHFSGICGLKPTPGRIPATGHYPASAGPFALIGVVGPMARTVADVKALFEAMQGPDDGDTCAAPVPLRQPGNEEIRKLRIAYF
jgi:Amidase